MFSRNLRIGFRWWKDWPLILRTVFLGDADILVARNIKIIFFIDKDK